MHIFEKEMSKEELFEDIKKSMEKPNAAKGFLLMRLYGMAKEEHRRNKLRDEIIDKMYAPHRKNIQEVFIIDDNTAIIKSHEKIFGEEEKDWFRVYYNGRLSDVVSESFDIALINLLCIKTNNDRALGYIARMLGIET